MKVREWFNKLLFQRAVKGINSTAQVETSSEGELIALSMVHHRDVFPYLLALKSFCRHIHPHRIVFVADPSITPQDRNIVRQHVPSIEFRDVSEFQRPEIPKGGCWERLCAVSEYAKLGYVIQLDADTVTVAPLTEVEAAVRERVAFTLGTEDRQHIQSCQEIAQWAQGRLSARNHVQLEAESRLDRIEGSENYRYIRGCAGFAGYPRGSFDFSTIALISKRMAKALPERWHEWGTEQFTSNLLIASMPGARILPHPKYCAPHRRVNDSAFFHFIGYVRYTTPLYARLASRIASELRTA